MAEGLKLSFITLWKLNDWGLYNRRNEAILSELAGRDSVERVLHVEHITLRQLIQRAAKYFKTRDKLLKQVYKYHIRKGLAFSPVLPSGSKNYHVYSVVDIYQGNNPYLRGISIFLMKQQYKAINKHCAELDKVILIAYPPVKYLPASVKAIRHDLLIADLVDDDVERTLDSRKKDAYLNIYQQILPECRWIFATSPSLNEKFRKYARQDIEFLPNGVALKSFTTTTSADFRRKRGSKVVGYVGGINKSMDTELLEHVLFQFSEIDFVFVGFCRREQQQTIDRLTGSYRNFSFQGACHYSDIPGVLRGFDVLMSLKKADYTTAGGDSMKIYEYLATGSPIVTTPVPPAEQFRDIIYVAYDKVQFAEGIKKALEENDSLLRQKRRRAAEENSWAKRVDVILDKVSGVV